MSTETESSAGFPTQYCWVNLSQGEPKYLEVDDFTKFVLAELFITSEDAFRHLARRCKSPWLVFVTMSTETVRLMVYEPSSDEIAALEQASQVMPPLAGDYNEPSRPAALLYYPDGSVAPINGMQIVDGAMWLHGQRTNVVLAGRFIADATRQLRASELARNKMLSAKIGTRTDELFLYKNALSDIAALMSGKEWDSETMSSVAELVRATGFTIKDTNF